MIAMLRGRVVASSLGELIVDVGGVGYGVSVPVGALAAVGSEVVLHTHLSVREDGWTLYGFQDAAAKTLFTSLLSVSGVGPKLALAAVSTLGADGLRRAVVTEDVAALTAVPGVGKKSAQRIVLELRERLGAIGDADSDLSVVVTVGGPADEVRQALASLGYAPAEINSALLDIDRDGGNADASAESMLRDALRVLGQR